MINPKTDGFVQFQIGVKVDIAELALWEPSRISAFFNGIAKLVAANGSADVDEKVDDEFGGDPPRLDEQDPPKGIGRPKDVDKEAAVFDLLNQGVPVSEIARRLSIHRNSVYCIKKRWRSDDNSPADESEDPDDNEPSELEDDTDVEDEPDSEPESPNHFNGAVAVKPKLIEALSQYPDGLGIDVIAELTGLHKDRVRAGLVNHRGKSFSRDESGIWTLLEKPIGASPTKPSTKPPADKSKWQNMVATLLKSDQPLELAEIARITKIPQADLFKILADEKLFERDTDHLYWLAK